MIDRGAKINTCDTFGQTPLSEALSNGHEAIARVLLDRGAKPNLGAKFKNELEWALDKGYHEVAIILIKRGARFEPDLIHTTQPEAALHFAAFRMIPRNVAFNFVAVARQLTENKFDLIATGHEGYVNAVHTALFLGCPEIAKWLLQREPSITPEDFIINAASSSSNICLANFAEANSPLDVEFLLQRGVNPDAADEKFNKTALHWAAERNQQGMVNVILENGSNPNLIDLSGQTPLHHAAKNGHEEVTRQLLDVTDASIIDSEGRTALRWARDKYHVGIVRLLLSSWSSSDDCTDSEGKTLKDWMDIVGK